jgi:RimJ/RimL family protein N-acetyltransferase
MALNEGASNVRGLWLFIAAESGLAIGDCLFMGGKAVGGEYAIAYQVAVSHQRRGLGREAVVRLSDWALQQAEVVALQAQVEEDNVASKKILTAAGFADTGRRIGIGELWRRQPRSSSRLFERPSKRYTSGVFGPHAFSIIARVL